MSHTAVRRAVVLVLAAAAIIGGPVPGNAAQRIPNPSRPGAAAGPQQPDTSAFRRRPECRAHPSAARAAVREISASRGPGVQAGSVTVEQSRVPCAVPGAECLSCAAPGNRTQPGLLPGKHRESEHLLQRSPAARAGGDAGGSRGCRCLYRVSRHRRCADVAHTAGRDPSTLEPAFKGTASRLIPSCSTGLPRMRSSWPTFRPRRDVAFSSRPRFRCRIPSE